MNKSKTYFVVDDDIDDQQFLVDALTKNNPDCKCFTASNGQEAIAYLSDDLIPLPDVIFLDLNMPKMNGKQCLKHIKNSPLFHSIPVIIYSTSRLQEDMAEVAELGAAAFLVKPNKFHLLKTEIASILAKALP